MFFKKKGKEANIYDNFLFQLDMIERALMELKKGNISKNDLIKEVQDKRNWAYRTAQNRTETDPSEYRDIINYIIVFYQDLESYIEGEKQTAKQLDDYIKRIEEIKRLINKKNNSQ